MMKTFVLYIMLCFCVSCNFFETEKITSEEFYQEELQSIDWNEIDTYPLFKNCDESQSKISQKDCFETTLSKHVTEFLQQKEIVSTTPISENIFIGIVVNQEGKIYAESIVADSLVTSQLPDLEAWLTESVESLPPAEPALKRGIPVKTRFLLPVLIQTE